LIFPVKEICEIAKAKNIISIIDGAHSPGQIELNLEEINDDYYVGNCHKWLLAPKGSAFIWTKTGLQEQLIPPIISWGNTWEYPNKNKFIAEFEMQGTRDISAFLSVPAAINFINKNNWENINLKAKERIIKVKSALTKILKTEPITDDLSFFAQMYAHKLPENIDTNALKTKLYDDFKIEIPLTKIENTYFIRPSFQAYNTDEEYEILFDTLKKMIK